MEFLDAGSLPFEGVVEIGFEAAVLEAVDEDFKVGNFAVGKEFLPVADGRSETVLG